MLEHSPQHAPRPQADTPGRDTHVDRPPRSRGAPVVSIVAANAVQALRAQPGFEHDILAFADVDALQALDTIVRRRPRLVVLGREFVGTPRGAELIARLRTDPDLSHAQIRVLTDVRAYADLVAQRLKAGQPPATAEPGELLPADFDGTRRSRRVRIQAKVEAQVDGMLGTLVDLSPTGAQVVGLKAVRPFQQVKVSIRDKFGLVRCLTNVAWVTFEPTSHRARGYRAGLAFTDAVPDLVEALCARHRQPLQQEQPTGVGSQIHS